MLLLIKQCSHECADEVCVWTVAEMESAMVYIGSFNREDGVQASILVDYCEMAVGVYLYR